MKKIAISISVLLIALIVFIKTYTPKYAITPQEGEKTLCFFRDVQATTENPYAIQEYVRFVFSENKVNGEKFGFQQGPDMNNGFHGTLSGEKDGSTITTLYSYMIEGSNQKEQEEYELGETTLTKLRYTLTEQKGVLVPNKAKQPQRLVYQSMSCDSFEKKLAQ